MFAMQDSISCRLIKKGMTQDRVDFRVTRFTETKSQKSPRKHRKAPFYIPLQMLRKHQDLGR